MIQKDDVLPRATEPPFLSALHAKNDTTNLSGYKLGKSTENNKALLFFSGKETIQTFSGFHLRHYTVVCEVISLWIAMIENSTKIYFQTFAWFDLSIKSYFLMVSSLILSRSLRVYILKQLFFSILVNSGFRNIYLATSWLGKYFATISYYSPRFQRIIVK